MTWYPQEYVDKVTMTDMGMRADPSTGYPGRTYRFYDGPVVYSFGHGLSYTKFTHALADTPAQLSVQLDGLREEPLFNATEPGRTVPVTHARCDGLSVPVHVDVTNAGDRDGSHTVLVYWRPPAADGAPSKQLVAFEKVHLAAGEQVRVLLGVDVCRDLTVADGDGIRRIPLGEHSLHVGDLTHTISLQAESLSR